jgi:hypothetical protein
MTTYDLQKIIEPIIERVRKETSLDNHRLKLFLEPYEIHEEKYKNHAKVKVSFKSKKIDSKERETFYFEGKITQTDK